MIHPDALIHPTAVVDAGAHVGAGTRIWHFCHVSPGADIGPACVLGQNVFVGKVRLGRGVKVQNNVSIYDGVEIGDFCFLGPSMVFTNVMNPRAEIERKHEYRPTRLQRGVTVGANATIVCGTTLGTYGFVAAGAVVRHDVLPYQLVGGVPARRLGWMCRCGERLALDREPADQSIACAACKAGYAVEGGTVQPA